LDFAPFPPPVPDPAAGSFPNLAPERDAAGFTFPRPEDPDLLRPEKEPIRISPALSRRRPSLSGLKTGAASRLQPVLPINFAGFPRFSGSSPCRSECPGFVIFAALLQHVPEPRKFRFSASFAAFRKSKGGGAVLFTKFLPPFVFSPPRPYRTPAAPSRIHAGRFLQQNEPAS